MRLFSLILCFLIFSCSFDDDITTIENLHLITESLSSDDMQGRNPGTEGGQLAKNYISNKFSETNLKTFGNSYFHEVPAVSSNVLDSSFFTISFRDKDSNLYSQKTRLDTNFLDYFATNGVLRAKLNGLDFNLNTYLKSLNLSSRIYR